MPYEPFHHKYRPQTFRDLVGQETISLTLSNALKQEKIAPAYLFTGPRGTGKTSSARILAKSLNCLTSTNPTPAPCGKCEVCLAIANGSALDVMEIDAASNTGVDNIREIIERSRFAPVQCRYKIYAIDECHMLSTAAFNALLKTLEEPPPNVIFILATTDPQRVLSTIISRCQRFDFRRIPLAKMINHLQYIAHVENIAIADEAITLIAQIANGGLRDAESLLDQLSLLPEKISVAKVWDLVGAVPEQDLLELLRGIRNNLPVKILQQCRNLLDRGREPLVVLQNLASFYLNLLIAKTAPQRPDLVAVTETCWQELCKEAANWDIALILRGQQQLKEAETQLKNTTQPRLWLEVTLLGLLPQGNLPAASTQSETVVNPAVPVSTRPDNTANGAKAQLLNGAITHNNTLSVNTTPSQASLANSTSFPEQAANKQEVQSDRSNAQQGNHTPPKVPSHATTTVFQSSESVTEPSPKIASHNPVAVATANLANEEIWEKVVSCLQPPTTQALLKQQCTLVSFDGSSAIVGISSVKLQGLHKGKVANIEAAFAQVCQRKIKVQLEVAPSQYSSAKNSLTPIDNPISKTPKPVQNVSYTPSSVDHHQISSPQANHNETIEQQFRTQEHGSKTSASNSPLVTSSKSVSNSQSSASKVSVLPTPAVSATENQAGAIPEAVIDRDLSPDDTDANLQQAIDNLTRSFEGELVQLDNTQNQFFAISGTSEPPELSPPSQGRPNVEDYDDDW